MRIRELADGEVRIDTTTNEIVLESGDRHCITGKEEIIVKTTLGEFEAAIEVFRFDDNSLVLYRVDPHVGRVEQVTSDQIFRQGKEVN